MILELPNDLQTQVEQLAQQRGTDAQTIVIDGLRAGIVATTVANGDSKHETREERRAHQQGH